MVYHEVVYRFTIYGNITTDKVKVQLLNYMYMYAVPTEKLHVLYKQIPLRLLKQDMLRLSVSNSGAFMGTSAQGGQDEAWVCQQ